MHGMFEDAISFNRDISKWDVSSVTDMDNMFSGAESFSQTLCGDAWVNSKATKEDMFVSSSGSISSTECTSTSDQVFSPQSKAEIKRAVDSYIECRSLR